MKIGSPNDPPMTVAQLVAGLQAFPQDAIVITEGCDCSGEVGEIELMTWSDGTQRVSLNRTLE